MSICNERKPAHRNGAKWLMRLYLLPLTGTLLLFTAALYLYVDIPSAVFAAALTAASIWALICLPDAYFGSMRYSRDSEWLRVDRGVIWRNSVIIPRGQIKYITLRRSLPERMFGVCSLHIHTAGGVVHLYGLYPSEAVHLRLVLTQPIC